MKFSQTPSWSDVEPTVLSNNVLFEGKTHYLQMITDYSLALKLLRIILSYNFIIVISLWSLYTTDIYGLYSRITASWHMQVESHASSQQIVRKTFSVIHALSRQHLTFAFAHKQVSIAKSKKTFRDRNMICSRSSQSSISQGKLIRKPSCGLSETTESTRTYLNWVGLTWFNMV